MKLFLLLATLLPVCLTAAQPNILFCLADDWGWPHAGAYGDKVVKTPTFDRLAEEGVLFENAFISSPSCTPSRNAVITGQQFYRLEEGGQLWSTLDVNKPNFMFLLRDAGYEIGHWRKAWGPGDFRVGGYTENPCGPDSTFPQFMENRDKSKPFCFWFGTSDPHRAYKLNSGREDGIPVNKVEVPDFYPDVKTIRSDIADYYWEVQRWDTDVGKAIALLEKEGLLDNTIIVMTGDHGMPFPRCKTNLYSWGSHVPLAIRWGNEVKPDRRITDFASFTDFAPTFLDAAGVDIPKVMTGRSLVPILKGRKSGRVEKRKRNHIVYGRERHVPAQLQPSFDGYPARAIHTDDWLLILNLEEDRWPAGVAENATHQHLYSFADCDRSPTKDFLVENQNDPRFKKYFDLSFAKRPAVELYDVKNDPDNVVNLADNPEYTEVIDKLRSQLEGYLSKTGDPRYTDAPVLFDEYLYRGGLEPKQPNNRNQK